MKITEFTNNSNINNAQFDYLIEVSAWADTGTTDYIGITGHATDAELIDRLGAEVTRIYEWIDSESKNGVLDARTDEPQIAIIRKRPEADEDVDFPPSHEWQILFNWNK